MFSSTVSLLGNHNDDGYEENVTYKVNSRCFKLYCSSFFSFNLSNVCEFWLDSNSKGLYLSY